LAVFKRGRVYWFEFEFRKQRIQRSTKQRSRQAAKEIEAAYRTALAKGQVGIFDKALPPRFREFVPRFKESITVKPATVEYYGEKLRRLLEYEPLASSRLDQVDEGMIQDYVTRRRRRMSVASVNRELAVLRRCLRKAREWKLIDRVPTIHMLPGEKPRDFVFDDLTDEQQREYLEKAPQPLRDVAALCLDTGLRVGEALSLTSDDVSLEGGYLDVRFGKSRKAVRRLYPSPAIMQILKGRMSELGFLFPGRPLKRLKGEVLPFTVEAVDKQHNKLRQKLGLPREFVIHSLRHTFGTRLGDSGTDAFAIREVMGHSSVVISQRYIHPNQDAVRRAFERLRQRNQAKGQR